MIRAAGVHVRVAAALDAHLVDCKRAVLNIILSIWFFASPYSCLGLSKLQSNDEGKTSAASKLCTSDSVQSMKCQGC